MKEKFVGIAKVGEKGQIVICRFVFIHEIVIL